MTTLLRTCITCSLLLLAVTQVKAFQFADAAAPNAAHATKYIFYWGQQQCNLTEEQQYQGHLSMTTPEFRQMLLSPPKLWNGAGLIADFSFNLQQFKVNPGDYLSQIAIIDQQFGQTAIAGQMLSISIPNLSGGIAGQITIEMTEPEKEKKPLFGAQGYAPFLNGQKMGAVVWGQEEKFEIAARDFFTVSEFWEIFGQEPYLEWLSFQQTQPVTAELQIIDAELVTLSLRFRLEEMPYSEFIKQVRVYQHLIKPGVRATLLLQTSNQYERLYQKSLQLVDDRDKRLQLRQQHDFHKLTFQWGEWRETIERLYLKYDADEPVVRRAMPARHLDSVQYWIGQKPLFTIDNEAIKNASFTIQMGDSISYRVENGQFDIAQFQNIFSKKPLFSLGWDISDIDIPGYTLPPVHLMMLNALFSRNNLLISNSLEALQKNAATKPGYSIKTPVKDGDFWKFELEVPQRTDLLISIFNSEGKNNFIEDIAVPGGVSTHSVQASTIPEKGKYFAFLNSSIGVTKVEFEVP